MRFALWTTLLSVTALTSCAMADHEGMGHTAMSHEEIMRHCQMMEENQGHGEHMSGMHRGTGHEQMMQHCAQMRDQMSADRSAAASSARQSAVAEAGGQIMPFDLERTTHTFADQPWGGRQVVVSDDGDAQQVALIRAHLAEEAAKFARGDFGSPEAIHGSDMPGLSVLRERYSSVEVSYAEVAGGGEITYRSEDRAVIDSIHAWFQAQRSDHGAHAMH